MPSVKLFPFYDIEAHGIGQVQKAMLRGLPDLGWRVETGEKSVADVQHVHALAQAHGKWDVYTSHGYFAYPSTTMERRIRKWQDESVLCSRRVTSVCEHWAGVIRARFGCPVEVIPNGFWPDVVDGIKRETNGEYVVWAKNNVGNLTTLTGYVLAIEIAKLLPEVEFWFSMIRKGDEGLPNVKTFGLLPHKDYLQLVANAGLYLSTCREAFSLAVVEAMGLGTPVVGIDAGGNAEAIEHGASGLLVEQDVSKLAGIVKDGLARRNALSEGARERAYDKFTWPKILPKYAELYEQVLAERKAKEDGPKVSIVVTAYNMGKYVKETVDSALAQKTDKAYEVIVVNDGSTDDTAEVLAGYGDKIRMVTIPNSGVSVARNLGVSLAKSPYITCLDGDDRIAPNWIERLVGLLDAYPMMGIAYTDMELFGTRSGIAKMRPWDFGQLKRGNYVLCCNLFRKKSWEWAGGYKEVHPSWEDYDLWLSIGELGWEGGYVPEPLFQYRMKDAEGRNWQAQGQDVRLRAIMEAYHPKLFAPPLASIMVESGEKLLEVVESALAQTIQSFEILVLDSDRKALERIGKYLSGRHKDPRIRVLRADKASARKLAIGKVVLPWWWQEALPKRGLAWWLESMKGVE